MNWQAWFAWHWPLTTSEWCTLLVFTGIIGWCHGTIRSERRAQRWITEHTKELEALKSLASRNRLRP